MNNLRFLITGLSFIILGLIYIISIRKKINNATNLNKSQKNKKIRILKMLSICLFSLGILTISLVFFPDEIQWEKTDKNIYIQKVENNNKMSVLVLKKEIASKPLIFLEYELEHFNELNYTTEIKTIDDTQIKKVQKYVISFIKNNKINTEENCLMLLDIDIDVQKKVQTLYLIFFDTIETETFVVFDKYLYATLLQ